MDFKLLLANLWGVFVCFVQIFMDFEYTMMAVTYTVVKVGGSIDPTTEVTHFSLFFSSDNAIISDHQRLYKHSDGLILFYAS